MSNATARITGPGDYRVRIERRGLTRSYRIHVPRAYRTGHAAPLLVALHGGMGDMDLQADDERYGLISASEKRGFIVVFPNGFSRLPSGRLTSWNAGDCCAQARDRGVDDVGFIRQVVANVSLQLSVDRGRIYATGMSNGGMMAYRLACDAADVFTAIAPLAATDTSATCHPSRPVSVVHFHARDDDHVQFAGGRGPKVPFPAMVTDYRPVPETIRTWARLDHCSGPPRRVLVNEGAWCDLQTACAGGARIQLCVTPHGGHSWPGGHPTRGVAASQSLDANRVMWAFFDSLPHRTIEQ